MDWCEFLTWSDLKKNFFWGCVVLSSALLILTDLKIIAAYSSVIHITALIYATNNVGLSGWLSIICLAGAHTFISAWLFFYIGSLYSKTTTRNKYLLKACRRRSFRISWGGLTILGLAFNFGCPPFLRRIGEILLFGSIVSLDSLLLRAFRLTLVLSIAAYNILILNRVWRGMLTQSNFCSQNCLFYAF